MNPADVTYSVLRTERGPYVRATHTPTGETAEVKGDWSELTRLAALGALCERLWAKEDEG